jgi:hypothetical protein
MLDIGTPAHQISVLCGVACHLAAALDALSLTGCDWFRTEIVEMLDVIDGQIALLEELRNEGSSSSLGL